MIRNLFNREINTANLTSPLLHILQDHHLDWMHACGGKGRCTTCKARILSGHENLAPLTPAEERYVEQGALKPTERLACQVIIHGDVMLEVPEEGKLPHLKYSM